MTIILYTTEVTPLPGNRLFLGFKNGVVGEFDLSAERVSLTATIEPPMIGI